MMLNPSCKIIKAISKLSVLIITNTSKPRIILIIQIINLIISTNYQPSLSLASDIDSLLERLIVFVDSLLVD